MEQYKLSVVIPVYNAAEGGFLERQVRSVLSQGYGNLELILVNDGSTDGSLELCRSLAGQDSRILVLDKPNGGEASARNAGIDAATGDYLHVIDQDDELAPGMYADMMGHVEAFQPDVIKCNFCSISGKQKREVCVSQPYGILLDRSYLVENVFPYMVGIQDNESKKAQGHWTMISKLKMVNDYQVRYYDKFRKETDHRFLVAAFAHAQTAVFVEGAYYRWIKRAGSNTSSYSPRFWNILSNLHYYEELFGDYYDFSGQEKIRYNVRLALIDALEYVLARSKDCNAKEETIRILSCDDVRRWMEILVPQNQFERQLKRDVLAQHYEAGYRHSVEHWVKLRAGNLGRKVLRVGRS